MTIHELYRLVSMKGDRRGPTVRCEMMKRDFKVVAIDAELAVKLHVPAVTDDEHFRRALEVKNKWF